MSVEAGWLADRLTDRTTRGIALETGALIRTGALPVGAKLPPIRDLAFSLGVSPATISEAWSELRRQKIITGRGRNGTWVSEERFVAKPERLANSGHYGADVLDLRLAVPDPALLPPIERALAHGATATNLNSYERILILPELETEIRRSWPYDAQAFLATNGGYNAVYTAIHALVPPGAAVAIEDPTAMRLLDILEHQGARIIPVRCDEQGPLPASLEEAMRQKPVAFIFQPRLHSVTGRTVTKERLGQLVEVVRNSDILIIEDDGVADISETAQQSVGKDLPNRVIHILSFSKTLGPDLRLAVLSGPKSIVEQIQSYRSFSAAWTSRILQGAAAFLLREASTAIFLQQARTIYQQRRDALCERLEARGIVCTAGSGLCTWVAVENEPFAIVTLAAHGLAVEPGKKFTVLPGNHLRVGTSMLSHRYHDVAAAIALAATGG
ncbi:PLP-dependent aminotransferase family protein [Tianweitania sp.]|uniref:aminotransferase-like domain-containing protein n=1 Tax=Tianweitania sp. TaxID=2021634 RepID=UPI00289BDF6C|nr:PLP-dependent aminotransferase family protein [Tianweitania sp.]